MTAGPMPRPREISTERLVDARRIAAEVVGLHGPQFLPIFERVDAELEERRRRDRALERVEAVLRGEA